MVAAKLGKGEYRNSQRVLKTALLYATAAGGIGAAILGLGAEPLAELLRMPFCKYALLSFAPTIWIMAYLGVLRGYFQGTGNMVPTAVSQILEQLVNAVVSKDLVRHCKLPVFNIRQRLVYSPIPFV